MYRNGWSYESRVDGHISHVDHLITAHHAQAQESREQQRRACLPHVEGARWPTATEGQLDQV